MVLNVTDEVINGAPKYNITDNVDGTKNITLANEVVEQGTALNKILFDKIENVLSYQVPSVEYEPSQYQDYSGYIKANDIQPTTINQANIEVGNEINLTLDTFNGLTPTLKITSVSGKPFITGISTSTFSSGYVGLQGYSNGYTRYWTNLIQEILSRTGANNDYQVSFSEKIYLTYDMKVPCNIVFDYYSNGNKDAYVSASNDGLTWTTEQILMQGTNRVFNLNARYYRVRTDTISTSSKYFDYGIMTLIIKSVSYNNNNIFTLGNETTFNENQRILLNTSSEVVTTGVGTNTLNDIEIDTILQPSRYYELVYNESQNKFIAQEVRN